MVEYKLIDWLLDGTVTAIVVDVLFLWGLYI